MKEKIAELFEKKLLEAVESKGYTLASLRSFGKMKLKADGTEKDEQIGGDVFFHRQQTIWQSF